MYFLLSSDIDLVYETLLVLSFILLLGMYAGKLFERFRLPHITGYILVGVLFGFLLVSLDIEHHVSELNVVSSIALGFIAFNIGSELEFGKLKKSGKTVVVITIAQAISAALFTIFGIRYWYKSPYFFSFRSDSYSYSSCAYNAYRSQI